MSDPVPDTSLGSPGVDGEARGGILGSPPGAKSPFPELPPFLLRIPHPSLASPRFGEETPVIWPGWFRFPDALPHRYLGAGGRCDKSVPQTNWGHFSELR